MRLDKKLPGLCEGSGLRLVREFMRARRQDVCLLQIRRLSVHSRQLGFHAGTLQRRFWQGLALIKRISLKRSII